MTRFGFGEQTGESEEMDLPRYENGHVEVSGRALKYAFEQYPDQPPKQALGLLLAGIDPNEQNNNEVSIDWEQVHESVQEIDGVGPNVADRVVDSLQEQVEV